MKKLRTQINVQFNDRSSSDENKWKEISGIRINCNRISERLTYSYTTIQIWKTHATEYKDLQIFSSQTLCELPEEFPQILKVDSSFKSS